jgi:hypothetical protein
VFEESTRTANRRRAERVLVKGRNGLEEGLHGLKKRVTPVLFRVAAQDWLKAKTPSLAPRTVELHESCLVHVNAVLGGSVYRIPVLSASTTKGCSTRLRLFAHSASNFASSSCVSARPTSSRVGSIRTSSARRPQSL